MVTTRVQYEPGADANLTTTTTAFADAHASALTLPDFIGSDAGYMIAQLMGLWYGAASSAGTYVNLRNGSGDIPFTNHQVLDGNLRHASCVVFPVAVTPGVNHSGWKLGVGSDGIRANGVQVGPDKPCSVTLFDPLDDILSDLLGELYFPTPHAVDEAGGSIMAPGADTTWKRLQCENSEFYTFPNEIEIPASGIIRYEMNHPAFVTGSSSTVVTFVGLWDLDTNALVPNSGMAYGAGSANQRWSCSPGRYVSGLTPGGMNLGLAVKTDSGTNSQVIKPNNDRKEGRLWATIWGVAA